MPFALTRPLSTLHISMNLCPACLASRRASRRRSTLGGAPAAAPAQPRLLVSPDEDSRPTCSPTAHRPTDAHPNGRAQATSGRAEQSRPPDWRSRVLGRSRCLGVSPLPQPPGWSTAGQRLFRPAPSTRTPPLQLRQILSLQAPSLARHLQTPPVPDLPRSCHRQEEAAQAIARAASREHRRRPTITSSSSDRRSASSRSEPAGGRSRRTCRPTSSSRRARPGRTAASASRPGLASARWLNSSAGPREARSGRSSASTTSSQAPPTRARPGRLAGSCRRSGHTSSHMRASPSCLLLWEVSPRWGAAASARVAAAPQTPFLAHCASC